jgi:hypothetical protein
MREERKGEDVKRLLLFAIVSVLLSGCCPLIFQRGSAIRVYQRPVVCPYCGRDLCKPDSSEKRKGFYEGEDGMFYCDTVEYWP